MANIKRLGNFKKTLVKRAGTINKKTPTSNTKAQVNSQTKSQPELRESPKTTPIEVTCGTDNLTFPGVEAKKPLQDSVQKFCEIFNNDLLYFQLHLNDEENPCDD